MPIPGDVVRCTHQSVGARKRKERAGEAITEQLPRVPIGLGNFSVCPRATKRVKVVAKCPQRSVATLANVDKQAIEALHSLHTS